MDETRKCGTKDQVLATRRDPVSHEDIKTVRAMHVFLLFRVEREVAKQDMILEASQSMQALKTARCHQTDQEERLQKNTLVALAQYPR
eukprot:8418773-Ditylum_brightwellii.AAC.1